MTQQVRKNTDVPAMLAALEKQAAAGTSTAAVPVPQRLGEPSVFEHIVYVIKENRTYDQVLGDLPQGNGDPELCLYPRAITPNQHALAEQFVLLDNYYCNGVNSADGHSWSTEGNVTDHLEKVVWRLHAQLHVRRRSVDLQQHAVSSGTTSCCTACRFATTARWITPKPIPADATFQQIWDDFRAGRQSDSFSPADRHSHLGPLQLPRLSRLEHEDSGCLAGGSFHSGAGHGRSNAIAGTTS